MSGWAWSMNYSSYTSSTLLMGTSKNFLHCIHSRFSCTVQSVRDLDGSWKGPGSSRTSYVERTNVHIKLKNDVSLWPGTEKCVRLIFGNNRSMRAAVKIIEVTRITVSWFQTSCQNNGNVSTSVKYLSRKWNCGTKESTPVVSESYLWYISNSYYW